MSVGFLECSLPLEKMKPGWKAEKRHKGFKTLIEVSNNKNNIISQQLPSPQNASESWYSKLFMALFFMLNGKDVFLVQSL